MRRLFLIVSVAAILARTHTLAVNTPASAAAKTGTNQTIGSSIQLLTTADAQPPVALKFDPRSPGYQRAWSRSTSVDEYRRCGKTNPAWDDLVISAMEDYVELTTHKSDDQIIIYEIMWRIGEKAQRAVTLGCDDALVKYYSLRYGLGINPEREQHFYELMSGYARCADALDKTDYHPIRKFYAQLRAADFVKNTYSGNTKAAERRKALIRVAELAVRDTSMPPEEVVDVAASLLEVTRNADDSQTNMESIFLPTLTKYWGNGLSYAVRGKHFINEAWRARGGGFSDSVTDAGWKGFETNLAKASEVLAKGWEIDPTCIYVPIAMITVCMGRSEPRAEMEKWFDRAMTLDPNCYEAVCAKANYLQPKWLGSVPEALSFGYECVASKRWGGRVPLILDWMHNQFATDFQAQEEKYFSNPVVWRDIKASYERFFELNPKDISYRQDYAREAFRCGQYKLFLEQLPKFGSRTNYNTFHGKGKFDDMVKKALSATSI